MHTEIEKWKQRFDERFLKKPQENFSVAAHQIHLKGFIAETIEGVKKEILEDLEKHRLTADHGLLEREAEVRLHGYDMAIERVRAFLSPTEKK